jgi:hypothetical protein
MTSPAGHINFQGKQAVRLKAGRGFVKVNVALTGNGIKQKSRWLEVIVYLEMAS